MFVLKLFVQFNISIAPKGARLKAVLYKISPAHFYAMCIMKVPCTLVKMVLSTKNMQLDAAYQIFQTET